MIKKDFLKDESIETYLNEFKQSKNLKIIVKLVLISLS